MHLGLILAAVLCAESVEAPAPAEPPQEERVTLSDSQARLLGLGIGSVLLGGGAAIGAWADRDGTFGRVSAITAGTLGTALLTASLVALITSRIFPPAPEGTNLSGLTSQIIEETGRAISIGIAAFVGALAGLAGGAVMSAFVSGPAGTQRGVLGVAGGGVMVATSMTVLLLAW